MTQNISRSRSLVGNLMVSAKRAPDQDAFRFDADRVTYDQLLKQASQLAAYLDSCGAVKQEPVALLLPRCLEAATAIYGVMYNACVWVPIDPGSPIQLVQQILVKCGIRVLVTHPQMAFLVNQLSDNTHPLETIIGLDQATVKSVSFCSWEALLSGPGAEFKPRATADDAAYVIHTSGSTGVPKGIVHTHSSGSSYAQLAADTFALSNTDVIGSHGPLHTDMCTFGFLAGPYACATTQIVSDAHVKVPASLSTLIESSAISLWYSVPQVVVQLLSAGVLQQRDLSHLRWLIYAGESLAPGRIQEILEHVPQARICNVYGPAETNQCMHYFIEREQLQSLVEAGQPVPIGDVWPETEVLLLDENDQIIDSSEQGELMVRSSTLMKGYWHDNRADDQIYFDNPADKKRYYRTGDLARRDVAGIYTLGGRIGRQVKVRGMRVELDAIELLLCQHSSVVDAAAVTLCASDDPGVNVIHAAVTQNTSSDAAEVDESDLQSYLREHLPAHAVPQFISLRTSMPLTSGGKIDRLRLTAELQH